MLQTDSIQLNTVAGEEPIVQKHYQPSPAQILSWYSRNLTPSQQDSVIQLHTKPKEIHWSQRPDTLHLPGHTIGKSVLDTTLPQYYKESFFSNKDYFHPEIAGGRQGVAGDPLPYTVAGDNFMTSLLLICFVLTTLVLRGTKGFIIRQFKSILYFKSGNTSYVSETSSEVRLQSFLLLEGCLMASILYFSYLQEFVTDTFIIGQSIMIALLTGVFASFFIIKEGLYRIVNGIFYDSKRNQHWKQSHFFISSLLGLLLIPLVLIQSYFHLSADSTITYIILTLVFFEILLFYRQRQIFFTQKGHFLQNILYFCMLEIVPLSLLRYTLTIISEYLKINF